MADKSAHKAKTRARILEEAAGAIRTGGTQGISVADLMKRAGLTHGGFYAHFASRDDLVAHAVGRTFEDSSMMLAHFLDGEPDLAGLIDFYLSEGAYRRVEKGCPLPGLAGEAGRMPTPARERFEAGVKRFRDRMSAALATMGKTDSEELASSVLAEMVGAMTLARSMLDDQAAFAFLDASRSRIKARLGLE
ncbi:MULTISPECIES: TetR/AcrR family transcriptional regulator [Sphingobium]|uniref:TetR family transcriptional regulator n=1 Tax=Sphingobium chungbukense TaxID=56193 RepID=A0A0M3AND4_9SPHN|nr:MULTISPECIES: TetR/AcrR family transcriptional regulator [Sphingobium]KKW90044.1 TetR family transcriptional regulator [Sphingobium chungbukense]PJG49309.1 TetR family transcriptional regulator [Sphingobium sp. LB126]